MCVFICNACYDPCEEDSEPTAIVVLSGIIFRENFFCKIEVLNINTNLNDSTYESPSHLYAIPLSLVSDTVTYIFSFCSRTENGQPVPTRTETLSFKYRRNFNFESRGCGFTVTLDSFQVLETSTFKKEKVKFKIHHTSSSGGGFIFPSTTSEKNEYTIEIGIDF